MAKVIWIVYPEQSKKQFKYRMKSLILAQDER